MAKKARTPTPPRRVQAPKRREHARAPKDSVDRNRRYLYALGSSGIAGLVAIIVVLVVVMGAHGGKPVGTAQAAAVMRAAGCTFTTVPSHRYPHGQPLHIMKMTDQVTYNSYPPSSGYHFGSPAIWDNYSQPVNPKLAVHNLEHGAVVVWYGTKISQADRQKIDQFYNQSPNAILVTPLVDTFAGITYPPHKALGSRIALTAWDAPSGVGKGIVSICPSVNLNAFRTFRDTFRGHAPEHFPLNALTPGR